MPGRGVIRYLVRKLENQQRTGLLPQPVCRSAFGQLLIGREGEEVPVLVAGAGSHCAERVGIEFARTRQKLQSIRVADVLDDGNGIVDSERCRAIAARRH